MKRSSSLPGLTRIVSSAEPRTVNTGRSAAPASHARPGAPTARFSIIEGPLSIPADRGMDEAVQEAARQFGTLLEGYVRRYPAEWRDWKNLKLPA